MSAVKTVQQMFNAGIRWQVEGTAVKFQSGVDVPQPLVAAINQNRREIMKLVRTNPTQSQIDLLAELDSLNQQWDIEAEKEAQGYPGETEADVMTRLCATMDRANAIYAQLEHENAQLVAGVRCLFPL